MRGGLDGSALVGGEAVRVEDLPHGGYRLPDAVATDVYTALSGMLQAWSDDPDRLAVACYAQCWQGTWWGNLGTDVDPRDEAVGWTLVHAALHRRQERLLRHAARGLLLGLEVTATSHHFAYLHDIAREVFPRIVVEGFEMRPVGDGRLHDGTYVLDRRDEK